MPNTGRLFSESNGPSDGEGANEPIATAVLVAPKRRGPRSKVRSDRKPGACGVWPERERRGRSATEEGDMGPSGPEVAKPTTASEGKRRSDPKAAGSRNRVKVRVFQLYTQTPPKKRAHHL